jgi:polyhydroxyalkanoate synthase
MPREVSDIASVSAPQHGPRPLPLFLDMLRSETAASPERAAAALAGLRRYQSAPRPPRARVAPARFRKGAARLRDLGGAGRPVVFIPSLINPPSVLDISPERSLVRWIAAQGFRTWLVDWGSPPPSDRDLDVAGHITDRLLPLLSKLDEPPILVGYCLGGTMALAAAASSRVAGVATLAAPWRFAGYGEQGRADMLALWDAAQPACAQLGLVPMEVLQAGFWKLDPARTIAKYERFGALDPDSDAARDFVALEDWANAGEPLTYAAGAELFEALIAEDRPGRGLWSVGGATVDPHTLACPAVEFVSLTDRIVPAATAIGLPDRRDLGAGHVGMIVGSRAREQVWEPLAEWLRVIG